MQIQVLGCGGGESSGTQLTALRINERLALDAGSLTRVLSVEEQLELRTVVLSHSHIDHTNGLPFFVENVYGVTDSPIDIYASQATIAAVRNHLFNSTTWPDFSHLPNANHPSIRFHELEAGSRWSFTASG
jgi:ribonuclease BN (tRNA processing enzyme)